MNIHCTLCTVYIHFLIHLCTHTYKLIHSILYLISTHTAPTPSTPVITVTAGTNSLSFAWPPPEGEIVARYEIAASYVGDCPEIASMFPYSSSANFPSTSVQFTDLQEFSNYSLSVTAVNDAGRSETSTLVATTLSTGELQ